MKFSLLLSLLIAQSTSGELGCSLELHLFKCTSERSGLNTITKKFINSVREEGQNADIWNITNADITSIRAAAFRRLPIKHMDLSRNSLTAISSRMFEGMPNLEKLTIDENKIEDITEDAFVGTTSLKELSLQNNELKSFPRKGLNSLNLKKLDLLLNSIETLTKEDLAPHNDLETLSIAFCRLKNLPEDVFEENTKLKRLDLCGNNKIGTLPSKIFDKLILLETVDLCYNDFKTLPDELFKNNRQLRYINLSRNELITLPSELLSTNRKISTVYLDRNYLTAIPDNFFENTPELENLYLYRNRLTTLRSVENLERLTLLKIENNWINKLPTKLIERCISSNCTASYVLKKNPLDCNCFKSIMEGEVSSKLKFDIDMDDLNSGDKCFCTTSDPQTDCNDSNSSLTEEQVIAYSDKCQYKW